VIYFKKQDFGLSMFTLLLALKLIGNFQKLQKKHEPIFFKIQDSNSAFFIVTSPLLFLVADIFILLIENCWYIINKRVD
jgi:hypothetical protein